MTGCTRITSVTGSAGQARCVYARASLRLHPINFNAQDLRVHHHRTRRCLYLFSMRSKRVRTSVELNKVGYYHIAFEHDNVISAILRGRRETAISVRALAGAERRAHDCERQVQHTKTRVSVWKCTLVSVLQVFDVVAG